MSVKRLLLIGANFKNKGAEAMAYTAIAQFTKLYPSAEIVMASYANKENIGYGVHQLPTERTISFKLIKNTRSLLKPLRVLFYALLPFSKVREQILRNDEYLSIFSKSDLVIDLSGYALTDQRPALRRIVYAFEILSSLAFKVPFVVFTQALGPFNKPLTRFIAKTLLPKASLLITRGESTKRYLQELKLPEETKLFQCSDSAYLFETTKSDTAKEILQNKGCGHKQPLVGIVPNINLYHRTQSKDGVNLYIQLLASACRYCISELGAEIIFLTHEVKEQGLDDCWLAEQVIGLLEQREKTFILTDIQDAAEIKALIGELDFLIASRFHSVVAAISTTTPFLAVGWSHKYFELVNEVGLSDAVLDGHQLNEETLINRISHCWQERTKTKSLLSQESLRLKRSAYKAFELVKERWP